MQLNHTSCFQIKKSKRHLVPTQHPAFHALKTILKAFVVGKEGRKEGRAFCFADISANIESGVSLDNKNKKSHILGNTTIVSRFFPPFFSVLSSSRLLGKLGEKKMSTEKRRRKETIQVKKEK